MKLHEIISNYDSNENLMLNDDRLQKSISLPETMMKLIQLIIGSKAFHFVILKWNYDVQATISR